VPDTLLSPHKPAEIQRRLQAVTDGTLSVFGTNPLMGRIRPGIATLRLRTRINNPFQPVLTLAWQAEGQGSRLSCRFATRRLVRVILAAWVAVVLAIGIPAALAALADLSRPGALSGLLVPPAMLAGAALLVLLGRALAQGEPAAITAHLRAALDAAPPPPAQGG
jgi:hypothetical protein